MPASSAPNLGFAIIARDLLSRFQRIAGDPLADERRALTGWRAPTRSRLRTKLKRTRCPACVHAASSESVQLRQLLDLLGEAAFSAYATSLPLALGRGILTLGTRDEPTRWCVGVRVEEIMSAVRAVSIQGFRSIAELTELGLRPLNVLIGANGSGKSNFLGALKLLRTAILSASQMSDYVQRSGGASRLLHFGSKTTNSIRISVRFDDALANFSVDMRHGADDQLLPRISIAETELPPDFVSKLELQPGLVPVLEFLRNRLESWRLYHFHHTGSGSPMKTTADVHDNRHLRPDGSNLAAFLYFLKKRHESSYTQVRRTIQLTAPFFDDFALEPLALNEDKIRLEWRHMDADAYFDASSLSDGTLRFIALATLLLQPASLRPSVLLLDEPELGLHPYAITLVASLLKQASIESQVVVATQSSVLLDHFDPEDVLVAERANGSTGLRRLDPEALRIWLEDYSLGQLWEKNELGGRPFPENKGRQSSR